MKALKLFIISTVIIGLTSCSKDGPQPGGPSPSPSQQTVYNAVNYTDSSHVTNNSGGSYFVTNTSKTNTITVNGNNLSYAGGVFTYTVANGIGGNTSWGVNINAFMSGFTYTTGKAIPYIYPIVFNQVDTGRNYTITLPQYITADNIVYTISNGFKTYKNTASITSTGTTFSATQIDSLFTKPYIHNQKATIEIIAINNDYYDPNGQNILFISKNTFHSGNVTVTP